MLLPEWGRQACTRVAHLVSQLPGLAGRGRSPAIGVAVSGGPDSMCLASMLLSEEGRALTGGLEPVCMVVDHRIRHESAEEAMRVTGWLQGMGASKIEKLVVDWEIHNKGAGGGPPTSKIQEMCREARYSLLQEKCTELGLVALVTAHNLDDNEETFLLRLSRFSGPHGLRGMTESHSLWRIPTNGKPAGPTQLLRPLLHARKAELEEYCRMRNIPFVCDPSNRDETFTRVRVRTLLQKYWDPRPSPSLPILIKYVSKTHQLVEKQVDHVLSTQGFVFNPFSWSSRILLPHLLFANSCPTLRPENDQVLMRLVSRICTTIRGPLYMPSSSSVLAACRHMKERLSMGPRNVAATVGGCVLQHARDPGTKSWCLYVFRERNALQPLTFSISGSHPSGIRHTHLWDCFWLLHSHVQTPFSIPCSNPTEGEADFVQRGGDNTPLKVAWTIMRAEHWPILRAHMVDRIRELKSMVFVRKRRDAFVDQAPEFGGKGQGRDRRGRGNDSSRHPLRPLNFSSFLAADGSRRGGRRGVGGRGGGLRDFHHGTPQCFASMSALFASTPAKGTVKAAQQDQGCGPVHTLSLEKQLDILHTVDLLPHDIRSTFPVLVEEETRTLLACPHLLYSVDPNKIVTWLEPALQGWPSPSSSSRPGTVSDSL